MIYEPAELVEKLAAIVPPPRFHLVRYHGILGPCASERDRVVPCGSVSTTTPIAESSAGAKPNAGRPAKRNLGEDEHRGPAGAADAGSPAPGALAAAPERLVGEPSQSPETPGRRARRLTWSQLLQRVFAIDVLECARCGGRLRLLAVIHSPDAKRAILESLGLPPRAPPLAAACSDDIDADFGNHPDPSATGDFDPDFDFGA